MVLAMSGCQPKLSASQHAPSDWNLMSYNWRSLSFSGISRVFEKWNSMTLLRGRRRGENKNKMSNVSNKYLVPTYADWTDIIKVMQRRKCIR